MNEVKMGLDGPNVCLWTRPRSRDKGKDVTTLRLSREEVSRQGSGQENASPSHETYHRTAGLLMRGFSLNLGLVLAGPLCITNGRVLIVSMSLGGTCDLRRCQS
jgi:hypothetical protein